MRDDYRSKNRVTLSHSSVHYQIYKSCLHSPTEENKFHCRHIQNASTLKLCLLSVDTNIFDIALCRYVSNPVAY